MFYCIRHKSHANSPTWYFSGFAVSVLNGLTPFATWCKDYTARPYSGHKSAKVYDEGTANSVLLELTENFPLLKNSCELVPLETTDRYYITQTDSRGKKQVFVSRDCFEIFWIDIDKASLWQPKMFTWDEADYEINSLKADFDHIKNVTILPIEEIQRRVNYAR